MVQNSTKPPRSEDTPLKAPGAVQDLNEQWNTIQTMNSLAPRHQVTNHFEAMGMALFHMGSAALQYCLIADNTPPREHGDTREGLIQRYLWAEADARTAQVLLNHAVELGYEDRVYNMGPEIKKHCRMAKIMLTEKRHEAARNLGIDPPPRVDEDVLTDQLDYCYDPNDQAPE